MSDSLVSQFAWAKYDFDKYHCGHFVKDAWNMITGQKIGVIVQAFCDGNIKTFRRERENMTRLETPEEPCIALIRDKKGHQHAGIFTHDRILHLTETGVRHDELTLFDGCRIEFYK